MLDLTHKLSNDTVVWPGDLPFHLTEDYDFITQATIRGEVYTARLVILMPRSTLPVHRYTL